MASGAPGRPGVASWRRWSASWTTSRASGTGCASPATGSSPSSRRPTAPTRGAATHPACPSGATGRTSRTGAPWPTRPPGTSSTTTSSEWVLGPGDARGLPRPRRHGAAAVARGALRPDVVEGRRRRQPGRRGPDGHRVGAGGLAGRARGRAGRRRGRRRRRAGRRGGGQPGGVGRGGTGESCREQGDADGRARTVGLSADTGRPLHLQPAGLPRHPVPLGRVGRARHGDRRFRHDDGGMPGRGRGGPRRVP